MRILVYGLNYAPELTGIGKYTGEMAQWLAQRGHEIRVITTPPYYPAWRIREDYRATSYRLEHAANEPTVFRVPLWVPKQATGIKRVLHLLSFAVSSVPVILVQPLWQPDVVFAVEPTFFSAPLAWLLARFCGAKAWLHVQDFEVDAAFELGLLPSGGLLQSLAGRLEEAFTHRFDRVSSVSPKMVERLGRKRVVPERRSFFANWATPMSPEESNDLRGAVGLGERVVVLYSGNMGAKQGLEALAPLAQRFADDARVHFLFCGDGAYRPQLEAQLARLANVTLLPLQPTEKFGALLRTADIHLLPQRAGAADLVLPSKLAGMLSSGRPVLATAEPDTQIAMMVRGRGLVVAPENMEALSAALRVLVDDAPLRQRMGAAARRYAEENLGREHVLLRFEAELMELVR